MAEYRPLQFDVPLESFTSQLSVLVPRAAQRAVSTVARRIKVQARRDIQQEANLKAGRVNKGLFVSRLADGVRLRGEARPINMIEFGATWRRSFSPGARVKEWRSRPRSAFAGAFIATGYKSGVPLVLQRNPKYPGKQKVAHGANKGRMKQPLRGMYGPSVAWLLQANGRPERLAAFARDIYVAELQRLALK